MVEFQEGVELEGVYVSLFIQFEDDDNDDQLLVKDISVPIGSTASIIGTTTLLLSPCVKTCIRVFNPES